MTKKIQKTTSNVTNLLKKPTLFDSMTSNIILHLRDLRKTWRSQDFKFTREQQQEYDMLVEARRERVKYFYENDMVQKGPKVMKKKEEEQED